MILQFSRQVVQHVSTSFECKIIVPLFLWNVSDKLFSFGSDKRATELIYIKAITEMGIHRSMYVKFNYSDICNN